MEKMTAVEVSKKLRKIANLYLPLEAKLHCYEGDVDFAVTVDRGWGLTARVEVDFRFRGEGKERHQECRIDLGWSSTGRTVAESYAAIRVYTEMTDLAALLESQLQSIEIVEA